MCIIDSTLDFEALQDSPDDYRVESAEDQLQEIVIVAYEAALEAGLKPARALEVLEAWAASERLRIEDRGEASVCQQGQSHSFLQAA
jgi:hypothetical protein